MDDQHKRLSDLMQARRLALGMKTWRALAGEAGISYETLRALRSGENIAPGTAHAVEQTLQWASGSIEAVLDGGEPTPVVTGTMHATLPALRGQVTGKATADLGGLQAHATGTSQRRSEAQPIGVRQTPPADDEGEVHEDEVLDPDLERAYQLLDESRRHSAEADRLSAQARELLAAARRARREGA